MGSPFKLKVSTRSQYPKQEKTTPFKSTRSRIMCDNSDASMDQGNCYDYTIKCVYPEFTISLSQYDGFVYKITSSKTSERNVLITNTISLKLN